MPTGDTTDVTATLTDLERKLVDLERELGAVAGGHGAPAARPPAPAPHASAPPPREPGLRVEDLRGEIADLVRFRDQLEAAARELVTEYDRLVARLRLTGPDVPAPVAPTAPPPAAAGPSTGPLPPAVAAGLGAAHPPAHPADAPADAPAEDEGDDRAFAGAVEIDAGPFGDIATLQAFEQALAGVDGAEDVYVKSFEGNRALIDVRLSDPVPLVRQLRQRLSLPMITRETREDRVTVDVQAREPDGT